MILSPSSSSSPPPRLLRLSSLLIFLFVISSSVVVVNADSVECQAAFEALGDSTACDTPDLTFQQLRNDPCPIDCQSLLDNIKTACEIDDDVDEYKKFESTTIFEKYGSKWTSCDYSYGDDVQFVPTPCHTAWKLLYKFHDEDPCYISEYDQIPSLQTEPCPTQCQALYDFVGESCKPDDKYFAGFLHVTYNGPENVFNVDGYKWNACNYAGYEPTDCAVAYARMNHWHHIEPCSTYGMTNEEITAQKDCPIVCQDIFDNVMEACQEGEVYLQALGLSAHYGNALIYHEFKIFGSCNHGYTPTSCETALKDLELNTLEENLVDPFGLNDVVSVCKKDDNMPTCSDDCKTIIDAVVQVCTPDAQFSPHAGYGDQTHTLVDYKGPETMYWLGLTTNIPYMGLSAECYDYYACQQVVLEDFDTYPLAPLCSTAATATSTTSAVPEEEPTDTDTVTTTSDATTPTTVQGEEEEEAGNEEEDLQQQETNTNEEEEEEVVENLPDAPRNDIMSSETSSSTPPTPTQPPIIQSTVTFESSGLPMATSSGTSVSPRRRPPVASGYYFCFGGIMMMILSFCVY